MSETKRGGPNRGQGRKPIKTGEPTVSVTIRMAASQRDKLTTLGGAYWVRAQIDAAPTRMEITPTTFTDYDPSY